MNKKIGGIRAGMMNATWPFATLKVKNGELVISCIYGTYSFFKEDLLDIQPYVMIPFFGQGVKINHTKKKYPSNLIFWYFGSPKKLVTEINKHLNETH